MSLPTRKAATQNPKEIDEGPRMSARLIKKQSGSHQGKQQNCQTNRTVIGFSSSSQVIFHS
jgi:hypothetical protein